MGSPADANHPAVPRWKWQLVWLMFLATMINYMDRQTLGSVQKPFMAEFKLDKQGYGWVEFAFGFTFATSQLIAGAAADRLSIRWLYPATLLLWSLAGAACGFVSTLPMFILCRVVLGFGESFNWPCAVGSVRRIMPPESRSFANGIFHGGSSIGAIVTPLVVLLLVGAGPDVASWIIPMGAAGESLGGSVAGIAFAAAVPTVVDPGPYYAGWRSAFTIVGGVGALWVIAWLWFVRGERAIEIDTPSREAREKPEPLSAVLRERKVWIAILVGVSVNVCWHFYRTWLPLIYDNDYQFGQRKVQWLLAAFYICADLGGMAAGYATRVLTRRGWDVAAARKTVMFGTASLCLLSAPAALLAPPSVAIPLFCLVGAGAMGGFPNYFALAQETSARHTAQVLGFTGAASWYCVAILNPIVGGYVDASKTFGPAIAVIGCVPLVGAIIGLAWPREGDTKTGG